MLLERKRKTKLSFLHSSGEDHFNNNFGINPEPSIQPGSFETKGRGVARNLVLTKLLPGQKLHLDWDENHNPIGEHAAAFASYCGCVVRLEENIPLAITNWDEVSPEKLKKCLAIVLEVFEFEEKLERLKYICEDFSSKYRNYRNRLRRDHYYRYRTDRERLAHPPKNVSTEAWRWLVQYWGTNEFHKMSSTNKANRGKNIWTHCVGRKSFARVIDEETKATGVKPTRLRVYTITRQQKSGAFINKHAEDIIGKARILTTQPQEDITDYKPMTDDQAFDTLFPPSRPGRSKCTSRNFTGQLRSGKNAHFEQHQNELNALQTQLDETRKALHETQLQLQQQQEQLKEVDTLRGDVGQLLSMVKTLSSTKGFSFPPFQTFNNGDEMGRANMKEPKLPASQIDVQPMEDQKEASQVAIDVLAQFKKKQKLMVLGKIQKFQKGNKCFKKERVEYREFPCNREPIDDLSVDM